jgi:hypothetical protein
MTQYCTLNIPIFLLYPNFHFPHHLRKLIVPVGQRTLNLVQGQFVFADELRLEAAGLVQAAGFRVGSGEPGRVAQLGGGCGVRGLVRVVQGGLLQGGDWGEVAVQWVGFYGAVGE